MQFSKSFYINLFVAVFIYILLSGLLIQLFILPVIMPQIHAGDGLLAGADWVGYQQIAVEMAAEINEKGWSAWQLNPSSHAPAGIAAAIYAITGISKPWVILPINAAIHAASALLLFLIIKSVSRAENPPIWSVLPFIFFPTALLWNTQFHKDGYFILGSFLFLLGMLQFINIKEYGQTRRLITGFLLMFSGVVSIWIVRPYGVEMVFYIGSVLALLITLYNLFNIKNNRRVVLNIALIWLALLAAYPLTGTGIHHQYVEVDYEVLDSDAVTGPVPATVPKSAADPPSEEAVDQQPLDVVVQEDPAGAEAWQTSAILPSFIDENLYKMSVMRDRYILHKPEAGANIDTHIRFSSSLDLIKYIPRSLQIGLLAPFPEMWFAEGSGPGTTLMRRASALEMVFIYLSLLGLLCGWWAWRKRPEFYLVIGFALSMIISYSLVVANVGTLHRMRYGFIMIIVALGVNLLFEMLKKRREKHQPAE